MDAGYQTVPADVVVEAGRRIHEAGMVEHPDNDTGRTVELTQYQFQQALAAAYQRGIDDHRDRTFTTVEIGAEPILQAGQDMVIPPREVGGNIYKWVNEHPAYQIVRRRCTRWTPDSQDIVPPAAAPAISRYVRFDDMTWPDPADPAEVEWALRYGRPNRIDLLTAASFIAAYRQLVADNQTRRNEKIRGLRRAAAEAREARS